MNRRDIIVIIGGSAIWPMAVRAQQVEKSYRVSYLALLPGEDTTLLWPFSQRLQEFGYTKDKNLTLEYRSAEGAPDVLPNSLPNSCKPTRTCWWLDSEPLQPRQPRP